MDEWAWFRGLLLGGYLFIYFVSFEGIMHLLKVQVPT